MENLTDDQALLLLIMLRVQHWNERVCDVLPCNYTCTFAETEIYSGEKILSIDIMSDSILVKAEDGKFDLYKNFHEYSCSITFIDIMKHISFEDKV